MLIAACTLVCRLIVVLETMISVQKESIFYNNRLGFDDIFVGMRAKIAAPPCPQPLSDILTVRAGRRVFLLYSAVVAERHSMVSFTPLPGICMPAMTRWFFFT